MNMRIDSYQQFLNAKHIPGATFQRDDEGNAIANIPDDGLSGLSAHHAKMPTHLHQYQRFCVAFALAKERAALFLECGLGKTSIALSWSQAIDGPVLISAPLAACHEFINEAGKFFPSMAIQLLRGKAIDAWLDSPTGVGLVTHHAMMVDRDMSRISGFVLDESSILKSGSGAISSGLKQASALVRYRLALSATPAPNDPTEYAAHSTWLGHMKTDAEFRARFFVRDGTDWRLKGHAVEEMPRWLASWSVWMRDPATYGMKCDAALPVPYKIQVERVKSIGADIPRDLLGMPIKGASMSQRAAVRKASWQCPQRMMALLKHIKPGMASVVWGRSNAHCDAMEKAIKQSGVAVAQIAGKTDEDERLRILDDYRAGRIDCLVSKPKIIGHGVNLQKCQKMVFAGYNESYEEQHQSIRRAHRQGRDGSLDVVYLANQDDKRTLATLKAKAQAWDSLSARQEAEMTAQLKTTVDGFMSGKPIERTEAGTVELLQESTSDWYRLMNGDCVTTMRDNMEADSMDLAVFSPPFSSLFTYSSHGADMGNCSEHDGDVEFSIHFEFFARELLRVIKAGRAVCLHLQQIIAFRSSHGRKGLRDFRGMVIDTMERAGFHYYGEFVISKNPQATAIRTKTERLQFTQFKRDSLESSPCLNDYVLHFRKPGKQAVAVKNNVSNEEWIRWASGIWDDIRESDVLSGHRNAKSDQDEKHICPLQLEVIRRCVRLWSNPGESVFTPFLGIGSEAYVAIEQGRIGVGVELKPEYYKQAVSNCDAAIATAHMQQSLF
jgi:DNA modification methylase